MKRTSASKAFTILYSFQGQPDGADPQGRVSVYHSCTTICSTKIFGNTSTGGTDNAGTIYSLFSSGRGGFTEQLQLSYTPSETGSGPTGPVIGRSYYGPFFGMASQGGTFDKGTAVELRGFKGSNAVLSFDRRNGAFPAGGLTRLGSDTYYTATSAGGRYDRGAIVSITAAHKKLRPKVLYSFSGKSDGEHPNSELTFGFFGSAYYGTTAGSKSAPATVYAYVPGHGLTTLYTFGTSRDGVTPNGVVPVGSTKKIRLFGTTLKGGSSGYGTLYELKPNGSSYTKVTLHTFAGGSADGAYPHGPPIHAGGGRPALWVVTTSGGRGGCGTIFSFDLSSGEHALLYSFTCGADGAYPEAPIIFDGGYGNLLYGTTSAGGTANDGVVFSFMAPSASDRSLPELSRRPPSGWF
jgi:uncharacterized repeat protein (TIGR03803 family)